MSGFQGLWLIGFRIHPEPFDPVRAYLEVHPTGLVKPDDADAKIKFLAAEVDGGYGSVSVSLPPSLALCFSLAYTFFIV